MDELVGAKEAIPPPRCTEASARRASRYGTVIAFLLNTAAPILGIALQSAVGEELHIALVRIGSSWKASCQFLAIFVQWNVGQG